VHEQPTTVCPGLRLAIKDLYRNSACVSWVGRGPSLTEVRTAHDDLGKVDSDSSCVSGGSEGEEVGMVIVSS
jgi:hypothetical protein